MYIEKSESETESEERSRSSISLEDLNESFESDEELNKKIKKGKRRIALGERGNDLELVRTNEALRLNANQEALNLIRKQ